MREPRSNVGSNESRDLGLNQAFGNRAFVEVVGYNDEGDPRIDGVGQHGLYGAVVRNEDVVSQQIFNGTKPTVVRKARIGLPDSDTGDIRDSEESSYGPTTDVAFDVEGYSHYVSDGFQEPVDSGGEVGRSR